MPQSTPKYIKDRIVIFGAPRAKYARRIPPVSATAGATNLMTRVCAGAYGFVTGDLTGSVARYQNQIQTATKTRPNKVLAYCSTLYICMFPATGTCTTSLKKLQCRYGQ